MGGQLDARDRLIKIPLQVGLAGLVFRAAAIGQGPLIQNHFGHLRDQLTAAQGDAQRIVGCAVFHPYPAFVAFDNFLHEKQPQAFAVVFFGPADRMTGQKNGSPEELV